MINELVEKNLRLVHHVINEHNYDRALNPKWMIDRDDLFQVGCEALIAAAKQFNADKGVKFSTYAYYRIRGKISNYLRSHSYQSRKANAAALSLDLPIGEDEESTFLEVIPSEYDLENEVGKSLLIDSLQEVDAHSIIPLIYEGYTHKEIGSLRGISKTTVGNWIKKLRREAEELMSS